MDEGVAPSRAQRHTGRRTSAVTERPDRVAMWAFVLAVFATVAAAASAHAASSGAVDGGVPVPPGCAGVEFGARALQLGDCGTDVQTLNMLLKSKPVGSGIVPDTQFAPTTDQAVKAFQGEAGIPTNGVVDSTTRKALKKSMNKQVASWYGPGFYGNETACGQVFTKTIVGVAHKSLPCGTKVTLFAHGNWVTAPVIDRGPFIRGRTWDLSSALAQQLGVTGTEKVRAAPVVP
jgi:peptidoglycan hydrolase-like protein with peptidoglycan-binding domain